MRSALIIALLAPFAPGCVLGDLDLTGKQCPCNGAYVCDESRNVCVRAGSIDEGDAAIDDRDDRGMNAEPDGGDASIQDATPMDATIPETCALDADCNSADHICENNRCVLRCSAEGAPPCPGSFVCDNNTGRCVEGNLQIGVDCGFNSQCASGYCLNVTTSTRAGTQRFCSVPCSSTTDCPIEHSCLNIGGISFCLRESAFDPAANFDTPPGGMCTEGGNTCQSRTCNITTSQCIQRCTAEDDCIGFGDNCWTWMEGNYAGICFVPNGAVAGNACSADSQCRSGVCSRYVGTCAVHCCSEDDCAAGETCAVYDITPTVPVKICRPKSNNAGVRALGDTCTASNECESELCAPMNTNGMGEKRCSVPCCEPTDCAVLPGGGLCWPLPGAIPNTSFGTCLPR